MKITKLTPETKNILGKMHDRRNRLDALMQQFAESDPNDAQTIAAIHKKVNQLLPKTAA